LSRERIELSYIDELDSVSSKLKDISVQAYLSLHGSFQGVVRASHSEIPGLFRELVRARDRCFLYRLSLKRAEVWDDVTLVMCGDTVIAVTGVIGGSEVTGLKTLEELVNSINKGEYSHGVVEIHEIPPRIIEEKLGVKVSVEAKPPSPQIQPAAVEEKPVLVAEQKPPEVERAVEEISGKSTGVTLPLESTITRTELLPQKQVEEVRGEHKLPQIPAPLPELPETPVKAETTARKPVVVEELASMDQQIIEFSDRLSSLLSEENVSMTDAVVYGDPDKLEVEISLAKLGWVKKREKMLKIAESVADILSSIVIKNKGSQKEIAVTVKHGLDAVRVTKKIAE